MNLRSKSVGIISALALSITMGTGIASAADGTTSVDLTDSTPGFGCTVTINGGTNVDFGVFEWNGSAYVRQSGSANGSLAVTKADDRAPGGNACTVNVKGTDITSVATGDTAFGVGDVSLSVGVGAPQPLTVPDALFSQIVLGPNTVAVALNDSALNQLAAPGTDYQGTVTFTTVVAP